MKTCARAVVARSIYLCASIALASTAGCAMEQAGGGEPGVEPATFALNGTYDIQMCSSVEKSRAIKALDKLKTMLNDGTLKSCLLNGVFGGYHEPFYNPEQHVPNYPEHLIRQLKTDSTYFECGSGPTAGYGWEGVFISSDWFHASEPETPAIIAGLDGIIGHEIAHTKGYSDGPANTPGLNFENPFIVPAQVGACAEAIASPTLSDVRANGALRSSDMANTGEVVLASVGAYGGSPGAQMQCAASDFAIGLTGRAGVEIDALGLTCGSSFSLAQGGAGGTPFNLSCFPDETLIGVHGIADMLIESIGPVCGRTSSIQSGVYSDFGDDPGVGTGSSENYFRRTCPPGHAVKGMRLRTGARVDRIELICQRMSAPRSVATRLLSKTSGTGGNSYRIETCPSRSAMYKIVATTHPTGGVGRVSGACKPVSTAVQNGQVTVSAAPSKVHFVPGVGSPANSSGFAWAGDDCSGLLIGVSVQTQGWIKRIRGVCVADAAAWSRQQSPAVSDLPWRGTANPGTAVETRTCPQGEFMVGLRAKSGDFLDSVEVVCRRF